VRGPSPAAPHGLFSGLRRIWASRPRRLTNDSCPLLDPAHVILSHFDFLHARWIQIWHSSAGALRNCIPLGISESADSVVVAGCKPGLLFPAEDAIERESRRRVFWAAFMCDRLASISSGWPHSLEEADVTVELPTSTAEYSRGVSLSPLSMFLIVPD
jgi:hypothetical protein